MRHAKAMTIYSSWRKQNLVTLFRGDCLAFLRALPNECVDLVLTSPPYCIGKSYERQTNAADFIKNHEQVLPEIVRVTKNGGSVCWQVGYHVNNGAVTALDYHVFRILSVYPAIQLRNRIVWTFGHGLHDSKRFSGRHELLLWFTKGDKYTFNLDGVRVPQKYPGKRAYKGRNKGQFSGNPKGKNPSDVWEIPNVKSRHIEKTDHPCQFPVALVQRLIRALTKPRGLVVDPFVGSGTSAVAAALEGRRFVGCDIKSAYVKISQRRLSELDRGEATYRPLERPIYKPSGREA